MHEAIEFNGLDEVLNGLREFAGPGLRRSIRAAALAIGHQVIDLISPYPTQPNPANPNRWYQRGFGSRWRRKDGSLGGRRSSEQLGQSWAVKADSEGAVVGTKVSYAPWVQEAEHQARIHRETGWKTDVLVVQEITDSGVVEDIVLSAVAAAVGGALGFSGALPDF